MTRAGALVAACVLFAGSAAAFGTAPALAKVALRIKVRGAASLRMQEEGKDGGVTRRLSLGLLAGSCLSIAAPVLAVQGEAKPDRDLIKLQVGLKGLNKLLDNWEEETTLCNYAEVTRELLQQKNKDKLLEAAKTNALFNKDVSMVVKCKRNPAPIREVMGFEDVEHPLYRADKTIAKLRKKADPDALEDFIEAEEAWNRVASSADSMSYGSSMRASALGEFKKGEAEASDRSFLESERRELTKARDTLKVIVEALGG